MEEEEPEMELDFDLVPTVRVGVDSGAFSAEVIELYELPFEKVMHALSVPNGPAQMMAMLEIFRLAVVDQTKLPGLDILSFNELADLLGQWAIKSTPPSVDAEIAKPKARRLKRSISQDENVDQMIEAVLNPETSLEELMEIADKVIELGSFEVEIEVEDKPRKRGRHAKPFFDEPLNDPGDDVSPF